MECFMKPHITKLLFLILVVFACVVTISKAKNDFTISKLVVFKENKGQVRDQNNQPRPDVLFSGIAPGFVFHLKKDGMHYQTFKIESWHSVNSEITNSKSVTNKTQSNQLIPIDISIYRVDVNWIGANNNPRIEFGERLPGYENFYNVPEGVAPALEVRSYRSITLKNIYDGIDLKYYQSEKGELEYDFIVQPGANYKQIQLEFKGTNPKINELNELVLTTPYGEIREGALKVYQDNKQIVANWVQENDKVTFEIPKYDPTKPIRIDPPTRFWGTYFGDVHEEQVNTIKTYNEFIYIGGGTQSLYNIATTGAHQTTNGSHPVYWPDGFIAKFHEQGYLEWATYYGGTSEDYITGIALDSQGDVYFCGSTSGSKQNIATPGSFKDTHYTYDSWDGFFGRFTSYGMRVWATYYGGEGEDFAKSIAVDNLEYVYVCGNTSGFHTMVTPGAHQTNFGGGVKDAFLAKFTTNGVRVWGTFYGGNSGEVANVCAVDLNHNVYIAGSTFSTNNIASVGAHQEIKDSGEDGFIAKFNTNGVRQWGTYYGGNSNDLVKAAAVDQNNNIFVAGTTSSTNNIATSGGFQSSIGGNSDGFFAKFNPNGVRQWGSYYGGGGDDQTNSIICTFSDIIYISGYTTSSNGIATPDGFKTSRTGDDAYIAKFLPNGSIQWGTYYGGEYSENGNYIDMDMYGSLYLAGYTSSRNNIATTDGFKNYFSGTNWTDAYLIKFNPCQTMVTATSNSPVCNCDDVVLTASEGYTMYHWFEGPTFKGEGRIYKAKQCTTGVYTYRVVAYDVDGCSSYADVEFEVVNPPSISAWYEYPACLGNSLQLFCEVTSGEEIVNKSKNGDNYIQGTPSFLWTGPNGFTSTLQNPIIDKTSAASEGTYTVQYTDANGCKNSYVFDVVLDRGPELNPSSNSPICAGQNIYLYANGGDIINPKKGNKNELQNGYSYIWTGPNGFYSEEMNPVIYGATELASGKYTLVASNHLGCTTTYEMDVVVNSTPEINPTSNSPLCTGETLLLYANGSAQSYQWSGPGGFVSTLPNPSISNVTSAYSGTYTLTASNGICQVTKTINVTINSKPALTASSNSPVCQGNSLNLFAQGPANATYQWTGPNGFSSNQQNPVINNVGTNQSGIYYVVCTDPNGCTNSSQVSVNINPKPVVVASYNAPVYVGETIQFDATAGMASYQWTGPNGFTSNLRNPSIDNAQSSNSGTYYLTVTNQWGCSTTTTLNVEVLDEDFNIEVFITPEVRKVSYGTKLTPAFSSSVTNTKYSYKWYNDLDKIQDNGNETVVATTIHYSKNKIVFEDDGYYYLKVTYGNQYVNSNYAEMIVTASQPDNNYVTHRSRTTITVSWDDPQEGKGDGVMVVVAKQNQYNNNILPEDGKTYEANPVFGDNSKTIGAYHYVVYNGNGNQVQVSNLVKGTYYRFRWYAYLNADSPIYNTEHSQNNPRSINTYYKDFDENNLVVGDNLTMGSIYPNPSIDGNIQIELITKYDEDIEVKIYNELGCEVYQNNFNLPSGENLLFISLQPTTKIPNGVYVLQVSNKRENLRKSFVISR